MIEQRTPDWHNARVGKITASRVKDVLAVSKRDGKPLQARADYLSELVVELLTGEPAQKYQNGAMQWGVDNEPYALDEYVKRHGDVMQAGFLTHAEHGFIGASPDGLLTAEPVGIEIKCPFNSSVHLRTWLDGMDESHMPQVQCQIWVADLDAVDFVSFDPRMPPELRLYRQRVERDDVFIKVLEAECLRFWGEAQEMVRLLKEKSGAGNQ